jgi:hypothetical protein
VQLIGAIKLIEDEIKRKEVKAEYRTKEKKKR